MAFLTTFIQTNLRKPIQSEAKGIGGRVVLSGIVETDGSISAVKAMNSLHPDCDREAVRVVKLFNAWKPAYKDGKAVRQVVTIPVIIPPNTPFPYANGAKITYFGADNQAVADSSQNRYKQIALVDTTGLPAGDIVVYETNKNGWKEFFRLPFVRQKSSKHSVLDKQLYSIGNKNYKLAWEGQVFVLDDAGALFSRAFYKDGKRVGTELTYHSNGSIAEKNDEVDDKSGLMSWYANGQIKQIKIVHKPKPLTRNEPEEVMALWDSTGHQSVKDGNGRAMYQTRVASQRDTIQHTLFVEEGSYLNGFKQGIWIGRYADGSYFYEEKYDKGVCQAGKARSAGADTVRYSEILQQPEFPGGLQGLGQFLSQNLSYPPRAQQANAEGKVFVSFVVCTDGTLCDYEVVKSVHPELDREAVRVVKKMSGRWKPGVQRGEKVRVKYNLPINFSLN